MTHFSTPDKLLAIKHPNNVKGADKNLISKIFQLNSQFDLSFFLSADQIQMLECGGKLGDLTKFWQDAFWKEAGIEESKNNSKQVV